MLRLSPQPRATIRPCLPMPAKTPPSGSGWVHEIKHDGFRVIALPDGARVRLLTGKGISAAANVSALRVGVDRPWRSQEHSADGGAACAWRL